MSDTDELAEALFKVRQHERIPTSRNYVTHAFRGIGAQAAP